MSDASSRRAAALRTPRHTSPRTARVKRSLNLARKWRRGRAPTRRYGTASEAASCSVSSSRELCSWAKRRGPRISAIRSWAAPASA